jgi:hypothetical protein
MKQTIRFIITLACIATFATFNAAAAGGKIITLKGRGMCAKCCLKEGDTCQNVVQVTRKGKKTNYYLADNKVSKDFHSNICKKIKPIEVSGVCKKEGDKLVVTAEAVKLAPAKAKKAGGKKKKKSDS